MALEHRIASPFPVSSYKARYPYIVAEAYDHSGMLVFDLIRGSMVEEFSISGRYGRVRVFAEDDSLLTILKTRVMLR